MRILSIGLFVLLFCSCQQSQATKRRFFDNARFFEDSLENKLESRLSNYSKKGTEIYVLTILKKEFYPEQYEDSIFRVISNKDENSVLVFLSYKDRFIRIITNANAQKNLPDSTCEVIIAQLLPYFSAGEYFEGVSQGVDLISSHIDERKR